MNAVVVWFRRDLRLEDNPALDDALARRVPVLPVYVDSPAEESPWAPGAASRWWLHNSLAALERRLAGRGLRLACFSGDAAEILPRVAATAGAATLVANRLYEPHLSRRDSLVGARLARQGTTLRLFDSALLFPPEALLNRQGAPYRVFTPFWRNARRQVESVLPAPGPRLPRGRWAGLELPVGGDVASLGLLDAHPWHRKLHDHWEPGEEAARRQLERFLTSGAPDYRSAREFPARPGSSRLSPHLHFGEITPAALVRALVPRLAAARGEEGASLECFLTELGWREFAHHVLWHYPDSSERSMNPRFRDGFWADNDDWLRAWQEGRTGIPLVDAGMRELWETGWMHNRVRMLVGSLLTKNLGIHWRFGARWFWDTLVDADLASNTLGWQWVAGCGVDAAPYFRIFNPETQAKKFDPEGAYVRRWLGDDLRPAPIVDLAESRREALSRYRALPRGDGETGVATG